MATTTAAPTTADRIAQRLHAAGCRQAFGIPGGEVLALVDALDRAGIAFHLAKHENSAGFMAEGVHHATGVPGVLVATLGPGVANAVNVVANALQDRVPLIFLTGCVDVADTHSFTHQVFDHQALLRPIVKASFQADPRAIDAIMDKALSLAMEGQPGPVHVDLPVNLATAPTTVTQSNLPRIAPSLPAAGPELDAARAAFAKAERPLLLVGVDVLNQNGADAVAAFAETHGLPVLTTYKAKGVLPEDAPLALGGAGLSPKADGLILPFLQQSDLLILAGYDPIEMRVGWRDPWPASLPVVELSATLPLHGMHRATWRFVGTVAAGLEALAENAPRRPRWTDGAPARLKAALGDAFAPAPNWGPGQVFATVRATLPRDTIATADSGAHRILLSQMWQCYEPRGLRQSTALCTMGCALPLAIGSKLATPDKPVVAFVGDAGLEMVLGELATARELATPVIVVVLVDRALALIELKQQAMGLPSVGVSFGRTDFAAVAQALGGIGETVSDTDALTAALHRALAADRFTVIACEIPDGSYAGTF